MRWKAVAQTLAANPKLLLVKPAINTFMLRYLRKFKVMEIGTNLILHSHLPPLTSKAYSRFVDLHLLNRVAGPSHAQIGLTNAGLFSVSVSLDHWQAEEHDRLRKYDGVAAGLSGGGKFSFDQRITEGKDCFKARIRFEENLE